MIPMWKRNAEKEILEAIIGAAGNTRSNPEQRTTRDNKNIMLNLFMLRCWCYNAWNKVRWQWRFRSLRPLTCWCREFSPIGLTSSFLARSSNLHSRLLQPYYTRFIPHIWRWRASHSRSPFADLYCTHNAYTSFFPVKRVTQSSDT